MKKINNIRDLNEIFNFIDLKFNQFNFFKEILNILSWKSFYIENKFIYVYFRFDDIEINLYNELTEKLNERNKNKF